jgi:hypothetical protein
MSIYHRICAVLLIIGAVVYVASGGPITFNVIVLVLFSLGFIYLLSRRRVAEKEVLEREEMEKQDT